MTPFKVALITAPNRQEADKLANGLVSQRFVACVNIVPTIESVYWWDNAVQTETECLLICKTEASQWNGLKDWVLANHPYDVPEIIQIPIEAGSDSYLQWIVTSLQK